MLGSAEASTLEFSCALVTVGIDWRACGVRDPRWAQGLAFRGSRCLHPSHGPQLFQLPGTEYSPGPQGQSPSLSGALAPLCLTTGEPLPCAFSGPCLALWTVWPHVRDQGRKAQPDSPSRLLPGPFLSHFPRLTVSSTGLRGGPASSLSTLGGLVSEVHPMVASPLRCLPAPGFVDPLVRIPANGGECLPRFS